MATKRELLEAELAEAVATEKYVALKLDPDVKRESKKFQDAKAALREARVAYRTMREATE